MASRSRPQCKFFGQGTCRKGAHCHFAHGETDSANDKKNSQPNHNSRGESSKPTPTTTNSSSTTSNGSDPSTATTTSTTAANGKGTAEEKEANRSVGASLWGTGSSAAWGEAFLEGIAKCEGTSGRKLYCTCFLVTGCRERALESAVEECD